MPAYEPEKLKRQEVKLDFGDVVSIDLWDRELTPDQIAEVKKIAMQLYEILNTNVDFVQLIQIGPVNFIHPLDQSQRDEEYARLLAEHHVYVHPSGAEPGCPSCAALARTNPNVFLNDEEKKSGKKVDDIVPEYMREDFNAMVAQMRDPKAEACSCGFPKKPCLRIMLRNGPPFPVRPCEPV